MDNNAVRTRTCAHPNMSGTDVCLFGMPFQHDFIVLSINFNMSKQTSVLDILGCAHVRVLTNAVIS